VGQVAIENGLCAAVTEESSLFTWVTAARAQIHGAGAEQGGRCLGSVWKAPAPPISGGRSASRR
jgi:hypothetical protein